MSSQVWAVEIVKAGAPNTAEAAQRLYIFKMYFPVLLTILIIITHISNQITKYKHTQSLNPNLKKQLRALKASFNFIVLWTGNKAVSIWEDLGIRGTLS